MGLKEAIKEAKYIYNITKYFNNILKIGYNLERPLLYIDNKAAKDLANNTLYYKRSKHINIIYYYSRDSIKEGRVRLEYIDSKSNIVDWLIKPINKYIYKESKQKCSLIEE
jgi:CHAT domain-containing protein